MTLLRKCLPVKFTSRLLLVFAVLLLIASVTIFYPQNTDSLPKHPFHSPHRAHVKRPGSSNLILPDGPNVVDAHENGQVPNMYETFEKDPKGFVQIWNKAMPANARKRGGITPAAVINPNQGKKKRPRGGTPRVTCVINNQTRVTCMRASKTKEVYMPFTFIEKYFQVYGEFVNGSGKQKNRGQFYFRHSTAPIWPPEGKYTTNGQFMYFAHYDVGGRPRVMLISGEHGVPISNQWNSNGHFYPIQVSQYGLSHFSKLLTPEGANSDRLTVLEDGRKGVAHWTVPSDATLQYREDNSSISYVYFNTLHSSKYITLSVGEERLTSCLSFDVQFISNTSSISIAIETDSKVVYVLTYQAGKFKKKTTSDSLVYGVGFCQKTWCRLHRDILIDLKKFTPKNDDWKQLRGTLKSIQQIELRGEGRIDNVTLSESCHRGHFEDASDWIARNQDSNGGWPVSVKRVVSTKKLTLPPGWYSAMGQGQAMSLLSRAYITYKKPEYLKAAIKGLAIFKKLSADHGVVAKFMDKYTWYEEYPTNPPLFVLNGFIYSLFGLYDLSQVADGEAKQTALRLFEDGMTSLKVMLPFFDSGTGTFYDLRHYTIPGVAPNRARWDYHAVHIAQLLNLGSLDSDPIFNATAKRWIEYSVGKWAAHN